MKFGNFTLPPPRVVFGFGSFYYLLLSYMHIWAFFGVELWKVVGWRERERERGQGLVVCTITITNAATFCVVFLGERERDRER